MTNANSSNPDAHKPVKDAAKDMASSASNDAKAHAQQLWRVQRILWQRGRSDHSVDVVVDLSLDHLAGCRTERRNRSADSRRHHRRTGCACGAP